ncbi:hypothetical protein GGS26DRAFT_160639 [Hypomontagnella submonticulosa]|nr:hypothetical protein GGS26DRAFT_160639 [Hypomontagnella submonticulosa]
MHLKKASSASPIIMTPDVRKRRTPEVTVSWEYFGGGNLSDWQSLMEHLGFVEQFTSKNQCRRALVPVWVNIVDFLEDVAAGREPHRFDDEFQLRKYTRKTKKFYPKKKVPKGSPLRGLFANLVNAKGR